MARASASASAPAFAELPPAARAHFKDMLKQNEEQQYKRALKSADAVLKVAPSHADTMAQKAFALLKLQRRDEAHDLVKQALKANMKCVVAPPQPMPPAAATVACARPQVTHRVARLWPGAPLRR